MVRNYPKGIFKYLQYLKCPVYRTTANNFISFIEYFDPISVKHLDAYEIGSQLFSTHCCSTAPGPFLLASHFILSGLIRLKCVNSATFFTSLFPLRNAFSCSLFQFHVAPFFKAERNGEQDPE